MMRKVDTMQFVGHVLVEAWIENTGRESGNRLVDERSWHPGLREGRAMTERISSLFVVCFPLNNHLLLPSLLFSCSYPARSSLHNYALCTTRVCIRSSGVVRIFRQRGGVRHTIQEHLGAETLDRQFSYTRQLRSTK